MSEPKVWVIIVTWNNEKDIEICLNSILMQDYKNYEVVVIDNDSSDKTVPIIKTRFKDKVRLKVLKANIYLTGANNLGIKQALKDPNIKYAMVLNPDTKCEPNLIKELVRVAQSDERIGAVGPKIKFLGNKNEGKINSAGLIFDGFNQAYDIGFEKKDIGQFDKVEERFGVSGTCILFKREMLEGIGLYWEKIKLHLDEVELFIRAQKKGWRVFYTPKTTVLHSYMKSTDQNKLYKIDKAKKKVWLWIAIRHYPIKSKLAMIKQYFLG